MFGFINKKRSKKGPVVFVNEFFVFIETPRGTAFDVDGTVALALFLIYVTLSGFYTLWFYCRVKGGVFFFFYLPLS
jgi:hypothetical protein